MMPFNPGGMPMDPMQMAQQMMQNNPNFQNNPQAQQYLQVLLSGDAQRGEELARNICQSYGLSPEQAVQKAQQFYQQNMQRFRGG